MTDAGYFPKHIEKSPIANLNAPGVREICSASNCISTGPKDWIARWLHNDLGWFNRIEDALAVIPAGESALYRIFAFRLYPSEYRNGSRIGLQISSDARPDPIPANFRSLGFDAASHLKNVQGIQHSPLSCNYLASELETNEVCLFRTLDSALAGASRFSTSASGAEPGDYYVIEVLERLR